MAHVTITKDLTEVKSKVVFGLTRRQLVFFVLAALVAAPTYFLTRDSLGNDIALILLIVTALPFFFFALYEKNGQPPEKQLINYIRVRVLTHHERPYRTPSRPFPMRKCIKTGYAAWETICSVKAWPLKIAATPRLLTMIRR